LGRGKGGEGDEDGGVVHRDGGNEKVWCVVSSRRDVTDAENSGQSMLRETLGF
jgi:hypothetical protein